MPDLIEAAADELAGEPAPARAISVLETALELGWRENPACSFVVRLTRDDGKPFYARWDMAVTDSGRRSWRFAGARASNGQPLAYRDIKVYLQDPRVIEPEIPDELCEAAEHDDPSQTVKDALGNLRPLMRIGDADPSYINGPPGKTRVLPGLTGDQRSPVSPKRPVADDGWAALLA